MPSNKNSNSPNFKRPADTIFIGGGTPSLLGAQGLRRILTAIRNTFGINPGAEITTESNPESTSPEFFASSATPGLPESPWACSPPAPTCCRC